MTEGALLSGFLLALALTYVFAPLFERPCRIAETPATVTSQKEALERQKAMIYQSIRDAELDRQTGKLSEDDYQDMVRGLKARAVAIIRDLDRVMAPPPRGKSHKRPS